MSENKTEDYGFYSNNKKLIWVVLVGSLLMVLIGGFAFKYSENHMNWDEAEQVYWEQCIKEGTSLGYSKYLIRFPEGKYSEEARVKSKKPVEGN